MGQFSEYQWDNAVYSFSENSVQYVGGTVFSALVGQFALCSASEDNVQCIGGTVCNVSVGQCAMYRWDSVQCVGGTVSKVTGESHGGGKSVITRMLGGGWVTMRCSVKQ